MECRNRYGLDRAHGAHGSHHGGRDQSQDVVFVGLSGRQHGLRLDIASRKINPREISDEKKL